MNSRAYVLAQNTLLNNREFRDGVPVEETETQKSRRVTQNIAELIQEQLRETGIDLRIDWMRGTFVVPVELRGWYNDADSYLLLGDTRVPATRQNLYLLTLAFLDYVWVGKKPHYIGAYWRRLKVTLRFVADTLFANTGKVILTPAIEVYLDMQDCIDDDDKFCKEICGLLTECEHYARHGVPDADVRFVRTKNNVFGIRNR